MAKTEICGLHCPKYMLWLFGLLGLWFTLSAFGVPIFGSFWSWLVLLSGICSWVCLSNKEHQKSGCPFTGVPLWSAIVLTIIGAWFVLGDAGILPTFGISLLYLIALLVAVGLIWYRR